MPRQGTGLRQRKNGWGYEFSIEGQVFRGTVPATTKREAIQWIKGERLRIRAITTHEDIVHERQRRILNESAITISDVFYSWMELPRARPASQGHIRKIRLVVGMLDEWTQKERPSVKAMTDVTEIVARDFAIWLGSKELAPSTRNGLITGLTSVWNALLPKSLRQFNPWSEIPRLETNQISVRPFTDDELVHILANSVGHMRHLFFVGAFTGLRLGDVCCLKSASIDMGLQWIHAKTRKTGSEVQIPIMRPLAAYIQTLDLSEEYVCPWAAETYLGRRISWFVGKALRDLGFTRTTQVNGSTRTIYSFHSFRHTWVHLAVRAGVPLPIIQQVVGHADETMTAHYAKQFAQRQIWDQFRKVEASLPAAILPPLAEDHVTRAEVEIMLARVTDIRLRDVRDLLRGLIGGN